MRTAIIDCGVGNLRSVLNAVRLLGGEGEVCQDAALLVDYSRYILPGVGAFGDGMRNLERGGWIESLEQEVLGRGKPFLGICLGMQMLAARGTENGSVPGMGWIPGVVERIPRVRGDLRVPHMGWNDVVFQDAGMGMSRGLAAKECFYFMHSFCLNPEGQDWVKGRTRYGAQLTACIEKDQIWATQFHPEKSQRAGLRILANFLELSATLS